MKNTFLIILLLSVISCSSYTSHRSKDVQTALNRLDLVLENVEIYKGLKQERICSLKTKAQNTSDPDVKYWIYDELYNEYNKYDLDSTVSYASLKFNLANECNSEYLTYDANLDIADIYIVSGMYHEAIEIIGNTDYVRLESYGLLPRYYHLMNTLYGGFAHASDDVALKSEYETLKSEFRQKLYDCIGDNDIAKLYVRSEMLIDSLKYDDVITGLLEWTANKNITTHDRAIIYYMLGVAHKGKADIENALICYTESAICDLMTPIRDYRSLHELAELLYKDGDFERASRYITRSLDDAEAAKVRINIESINSRLPVIYNSYNAFIKTKNRILYNMLFGISILLVLLVCTTIATVKKNKRIAVTEKIIKDSNMELMVANDKLQKYIVQLKESNEIKETYIRRYIDLCSDYIGRMEKYRSELRALAKSGGYDAVLKELRSTEVIDKELAEFYAQFDATFLDLFPDFTSQLNSLLQSDKQLETKDGLLTTELRVCALIRLGVTDSVKMSAFLRRSVSTIYNYRVKMRNAAINKREDLEKDIMKIGKSVSKDY